MRKAVGAVVFLLYTVAFFMVVMYAPRRLIVPDYYNNSNSAWDICFYKDFMAVAGTACGRDDLALVHEWRDEQKGIMDDADVSEMEVDKARGYLLCLDNIEEKLSREGMVTLLPEQASESFNKDVVLLGVWALTVLAVLMASYEKKKKPLGYPAFICRAVELGVFGILAYLACFVAVGYGAFASCPYSQEELGIYVRVFYVYMVVVFCLYLLFLAAAAFAMKTAALLIQRLLEMHRLKK